MANEVVSYIFVGTPDPDPRTVKNRLAKQPGVYFVAEFVGTFHVFAAVEHDTFQELQEAISVDYWQQGLRSETSELIQSSRLAAPKRGSPPYCGIIRAEVVDRDPFDVLDELDNRFDGRFNADPNHDHFWYGAGVVTGKYDLLIDLGADSTSEIDRMVVRDVRSVSGIRRTVTAHAYLPGNGYRYGKPIPLSQGAMQQQPTPAKPKSTPRASRKRTTAARKRTTAAGKRTTGARRKRST